MQLGIDETQLDNKDMTQPNNDMEYNQIHCNT